jgi:hypothetical protein
VAGDRRVVPLAAVLGGVAFFASLISEWQVTSIDTSLFNGSLAGLQPIPTGVMDLDGWAAGYLVGLFVLTASVVLVLFGPPAGRRYARLIGLSAGGVTFALLAALEPTLDDVSRTLGFAARYQFESDQLRVEGGRGIWCGFIGVVATMVALYLAGRHVAPSRERAAESAGTEPAADDPEIVWSWRRSRTEDEDQPPAAPFELTVSPTRPFTSLDDDRDKPSDRDGISG